MRIFTALFVSLALIMGTAVSANAIVLHDQVTNVRGSNSSITIITPAGKKATLAPGKGARATSFTAPKSGKTYYKTNAATKAGQRWTYVKPGGRVWAGPFLQVDVR